jgi:hypothetical protein
MSTPMPGHEPGNEEVRFEREDVNSRSTLWFGIWILVVMVVVAVLVKPFYDMLAEHETRTQPPAAYALPTEPPAPDATTPRLQVEPVADLATLRAHEDRILDSYAWVDKEKGVARIPVEDAMRLVAEQGLPVFPPAPTTEKETR